MADRERLLDRLRAEHDESAYTNEELASRGHQARQIMQSAVFRDAIFDADLTMIEEWRNNQEASPAGRERAHAAVRGLDVMWTALVRVSDAGLVAEKRIEDAQGGDDPS